MPARVHIPSLLRQLFGAQPLEEVEAGSVAEMIEVLDRRYPGMGARLLEPDGSLRRWVHIFVRGETVRRDSTAEAGLDPGAEVWIVPNVAGGTRQLDGRT